jgi:hypothetical protein
MNEMKKRIRKGAKGAEEGGGRDAERKGIELDEGNDEVNMSVIMVGLLFS